MTRRVEHGAQSHARQKLFEALYCLVGNGSFRDRLIHAASPLTELLPSEVEQLPDTARDRFTAVVDALTKYPPSPKPSAIEWGVPPPEIFESGIEASVHKLTPRQRRKIAEEILSMFVALSGGL
jgi:hypothetical protein